MVAVRDFRYQGDAIVAEQLTDAAHPAPGTVVRSYVVDDAGSIVKMTIPSGEAAGGTYLPTWSGHGDALALWRQEPDGTLTLANSYQYDTWGRPTTATHNGIGDLGFRFLYVGEFDVQWDDAFGLGLAYMHARHYHPALGRFLTPDPDASEANLYAYAANSPVTELDPDGTCFIVLCIAVGVVLFGGLGAALTTASYTTTTPIDDWRADDAAGAAAGGFVEAGSYAIGGPGLGAGVIYEGAGRCQGGDLGNIGSSSLPGSVTRVGRGHQVMSGLVRSVIYSRVVLMVGMRPGGGSIKGGAVG
jgi:RHS repeat-associated protein